MLFVPQTDAKGYNFFIANCGNVGWFSNCIDAVASMDIEMTTFMVPNQRIKINFLNYQL